MTRVRPLAILVLTAAMALAVAACGSTGTAFAPASSTTDVDQLLRETFAGDHKVDSGRIDLNVRVEKSGPRSHGPASLRLSGPFESQGTGRLPDFALNAELTGAGHDLAVGATSTGGTGYVNVLGRDYVLAGPLYEQVKAGYEEAAKQAGGSVPLLGIDPRRWVKDPQNAGEAKVGDADTIKITGGVDVKALLDDLNSALNRAKSLGLKGADKLPDQLTPAERRKAEEAVKEAKVELYTGKDDRILRRLRVDVRTATPKGTSRLELDLSLTGVNEDQEIAAPSDARPFDELTRQLRALGIGLGGLGGSGGGPGPGSAGAGGSQVQRYAHCIARAGTDAAAARECAALLAP
jgi:hypothetical protein